MKPITIITLLLTLFTFNSFASENNNTTDLNTTQDFNISNENNLTENIDIEVNTDNCVGCHGLYFEKMAMGMSKVVNEMSKEYIEATLFNYKYNSVEGDMNPLMSWQTAQLSDDEIRAIAKQIGK